MAARAAAVGTADELRSNARERTPATVREARQALAAADGGDGVRPRRDASSAQRRERGYEPTAREAVAPQLVVTVPSAVRLASQPPTSISEHFQIEPACMQPISDSACSAVLPRRQVDTTSSATPGWPSIAIARRVGRADSS